MRKDGSNNMAKVIGYDKKAVKRCTCEECGARIEYVKADVKEYHGRDISGGPDGYTFIVCPGCGEKVILESW